MNRRWFLRTAGGASVVSLTVSAALGSVAWARTTTSAGPAASTWSEPSTGTTVAAAVSRFGGWSSEAGFPVFTYHADQRVDPAALWDPTIAPPTTRMWTAVGNRWLQMVADNEGGVGVWDTGTRLRWLTAPSTGLSVVGNGLGEWGTDIRHWPAGVVPRRTWGPTWFTVEVPHRDLTLRRTVFCPEGDVPWLLVRVEMTPTGGGPRTVELTEQRKLKPRYVDIGLRPEPEDLIAALRVRYEVSVEHSGLVARERRIGATGR
ncbi:MAG TPA: hypothetical protein VGM60_03015 [Pseudonocardia sp.]|uniref:hypothetical protein n=1 Tax=Pseudonocardia sp. TaxID=60912 RepID=UPI002F41C280